MRVAWLVPAGFFAGAAWCALMLRHSPAAFAVDRAQPLVVVTYWHAFGAQMWLAFALAVAIASAGYIAALASSGSASFDKRYLFVTTVVCAIACAAALLFPVVFSSDVYAYAGYGDMALHGVSPYSHAHVALRDPLLSAMVWQWGNPPPMCVYGPAFVWLAQAIVAALLPLGAAAPLWALRILACLALVACAPLAYLAFSGFPQSVRRAAAAGIALNPIAIWSSAEGHNDALTLAIVLAGFALAARSRWFAGALVVALSALVKAPGVAAAALLALSHRHDRSRFVKLAWGAGAGIALVLALAVPLEYGVRTQLAPSGSYFPQFSVQYVSIVVTALLFGLLLAVAVLHRSWVYLAFAVWLLIPNPYPWYALWLVPVAFLAWPSRAAWALIAASLLMVVRYYPDATTAHFSRPLGIVLVAIECGLPLLLLTAHMASAHRGRPEIHTPAPDFAMPRSP